MQATRSNNKVLDFLMRQKNEGKLPGILGRLVSITLSLLALLLIAQYIWQDIWN